MNRPQPSFFRRALCVVALLTSNAAAGAAVAAEKPIDLPLLLELPGDLAPVRYTPGSLDRSASVQTRFELLAKEFGRSGFDANALVLFVLSPEDWKFAGLAATYGYPQRVDLDGLALPAWANEKVVKQFRDELGGELPLPLGNPLLATPAEAGALAVSDLLAQLEVSAILVRRAGLHGDQPWIEGLLAHLVARLVWDKFESGRMPGIAAIFDRLSANASQPANPVGSSSIESAPRTLSEWRPDLPYRERYWYDARLLRAADQMVAAKSAHRLWRMLAKAIEKKHSLTEAMLFKEFPGLAAWKAENFPAG